MKKLMLSAAVIAVSLLTQAAPTPLLDVRCTGGNFAAVKDVSANACKVSIAQPGKLSWSNVENELLLTFSGDLTQPRPRLLVKLPQDFKFNAPFTLQFKFKTAGDHNQKVRNQFMQYGYGADRISGFTIFLFMKSLHFRFGSESKTGVKSNDKIVPILPDTEYNAVLVYDTKNITMYLNGREVLPPTPAVIPAMQQKPFTLGATASTGGGYAFKGAIRSVKVFNQALSGAEAVELK